MKLRRGLFFLSIVLWASMTVAQTGGENSELKLGVEAYKHSKFDEAIEHFEKAVEQDPANVHARLYLATTRAAQYIPGVDTPDNNDMGEKAIEQYTKVIELAPPKSETINAVKGVALFVLTNEEI